MSSRDFRMVLIWNTQAPFIIEHWDNLLTADQDPQLIKDKLQKEINIGHMVGPFKDPPPLPGPHLFPGRTGPQKGVHRTAYNYAPQLPLWGIHQ